MTEAQPAWSVIVPYYNELDFIEGTIRSAIAQAGTSFRLILVDNKSSDGTEDLCRRILAEAPQVDVLYLHEERPGHLFALDKGFSAVTTPYVCFWDADTVYPPHYLSEAERLLEDGRHVAAQAVDIYCDPESAEGKRRRLRMKATQCLLSRQGHIGSYGQCFRTAALRAAGGPMSADWGYVLYDHELMQRIFKQGNATGSTDLWCLPSPRRGANAHVRWTLWERILYHATPFALKDWFFYRFLARRFDRRRMVQENLRVRDW
ncbi:MAG TPA: glycosyltransferase family 2 protein [Sphingobium sp.]|uniref:glycosyltransferase family 2 protein n=1 Tax=Sphingobium sp. TaxID=1912891 RepID=UPI002ED03D30